MKYMDMAIQLARGQDSSNKHFMLAAVAKRFDGSLLVSSNIRTAHPIHSAHAEHRILSRCGLGATLWVARVDRMGDVCMAKPCQKCEALCKNKRVRRIYYSISNSEHGCLEF